MKTSSPAEAQELPLKRRRLDEEEDEDVSSPEELRKATIEEYIETCRGIYLHPLLSEETRMQYEKHVFTYMRTTTVEEAERNIGWLQDVVSKVEAAESRFESMIAEALSRRWINAASANRWRARFTDPGLLEFVREQWLEDKFPAYLRRWERVADERKTVLRRAELQEVDASDEPELAVLQNQDAFLALDYHHRCNLVNRLDALVMATALHKRETYRSLRDEVQESTRGPNACLHSAQVGVLLKEIFSQQDPRAYFSDAIVPMLQRRQALRREYDVFQHNIAAAQLPSGMRLPSLSAFLQWSEEACAVFLEEGRNRLRASLREQEAEESVLAQKKTEVRHAMDRKDWRGAEAVLISLSQSDDKELAVLQRYLEAHRDDLPERKPSISELLREMNSMIRGVPPSMQGMYIVSLQRGSKSFERVMQHMYLAVWSADQQAFEGKKSQADAAADASRGSVRRIGGGEDHTEQAEDGVSSVVEVASDQESQLKALDLLERQDVRSQRAECKGMVSDSLSLKQQRYLVDHINAPLMGRLRRLEGEGIAFALAA